MGSVVPVRRGQDYARALVLDIYRRNRDAIASTGEPDLVTAVALLDDALQDPNTRQAMLYAMADLISAAMQGVCLDVGSWTPPRPPL